MIFELWVVDVKVNKILEQHLSATSKNTFLPNFILIFLFFSVFTFFMQKMWKSIFWPAFGVHSTQTLFKIYNIEYRILSYQKYQLMPKFLFIWLLKVCCRRLLETRPWTSCPQERAWTLQQHDQDQRLHRGVRHQEPQHRQETRQGWSNALLVGWWDSGLVRCWGCPVPEWYPATEWWC